MCGAGAAWRLPSAKCHSWSAPKPPAWWKRSVRASAICSPASSFPSMARAPAACAAPAAKAVTICANMSPACTVSTSTALRRKRSTCRPASSSPPRPASTRSVQRLRPSPSAPSSTCCSTMRSSSRAKPFSFRPAAPALAPPPSSLPRAWAAPSSPRWAQKTRWRRQRRSARIMSSTTARTVSRALCARSRRSAVSMWCSSMWVPIRGQARSSP